MKRILLLALGASASALASADLLYTINEDNMSLYTVNTANGNLGFVGALGVRADFGDLSYDQANNTMYMINGWGNGVGAISSLYKVNLNTGAATLVGSTGVTDLFGLAYDPQTGNMYASKSTISNGFYSINVNTGAASFIGNPGHSLDGLTYVGSTGQIVGLEAGPGGLYSVNRNNGSVSQVGGSGFVNNCGIAWVASNNSVYAADYSGSLYRYDVANNYARTLVANLGAEYDGLAAVPEPTTLVAVGAGLLALARKRRK